MEFFQKVPCTALDLADLKRLLTIKNLPVLCSSINTVISEKGDTGEIYCIWGEFSIRRDEIRYGVRYSLLTCPHALAWTITLDELDQNITIHCTIDSNEQEEEFVDSIYEFVTDWSHGLAEALASSHGQA